MHFITTWNYQDCRRTSQVCTGETYKDFVKLTFAKGASLTDPAGLFNSSLEGNSRRAIDLREGTRPMKRRWWRSFARRYWYYRIQRR
jgi:hypothetical protein